MLYSAMERSSENLMLNVFTARDLELLNERKQKQTSAAGEKLNLQRGSS